MLSGGFVHAIISLRNETATPPRSLGGSLDRVFGDCTPKGRNVENESAISKPFPLSLSLSGGGKRGNREETLRPVLGQRFQSWFCFLAMTPAFPEMHERKNPFFVRALN